MRQFSQQINTSDNLLAGRDQHLTGNWQVQLGETRQAQVCAALPLPYTLAELDERSRRQTEAVTAELQNDILTFIRLYPERVGLIIDRLP